MHFKPDERIEKIQQWLEEDTFRSRCVDEETHDWLAHVEISTSCGVVLDTCHYLDEYPVCGGDTLTVVLVPADSDFEGRADPGFWACRAARSGASQPASFHRK